MNVQRFQVDPRLTAYIESIWTFETEIGLPANDLRTIVPSARPKLVIPYRGRMFSVINNRRIEHPEASMILVGMMERSVVIDSSAIGVLAIEFKPGTVYRFLDFPLKEVMKAHHLILDNSHRGGKKSQGWSDSELKCGKSA